MTTHNLPRYYKEPGKHCHVRLEEREKKGVNRIPQHDNTYNTESQLTDDAILQSDNLNDN